MADNNIPNEAIKGEGRSSPNGDDRGISHRDQKGSNSQQGRGGGGRSGRRGIQSRGNKKGFGSNSNNRNGRHKKGDMGRGEYKYAPLHFSAFAQLTK